MLCVALGIGGAEGAETVVVTIVSGGVGTDGASTTKDMATLAAAVCVAVVV